MGEMDSADSGVGFQSLLQAIEAEDTEGRIEIHIYLTAKIE
jgi:NADPH oxidase